MNIFELHGKPVLWAGSDESFEAVAHAQQRVDAALKDGSIKDIQARMGAANLDGQGLPKIWSKEGNTATINISGSLVDGEAGFYRFFGVIGYDDIAKASIEAYSDPDVTRVMRHIDSPGGQVSGIMDCGAILSKLSDLKTTMTYSGGLMCSGGYWLGTSGKGLVVAGPTAEIGSIGVITVVTNTSKMYEDMGISKTVMRAGENKARVNAIEPMTAEVKAKLQQNLDDIHAIFKAQVAVSRPEMTAEDLAAATDGSTFLGKRAKSAGLVDKIASYSQALKLLDSQNPTSNTPSNSKGAAMKVQLTDAQIQLISAGVAIDAIGLSADDVVKLRAEMEADAAAEAEAAATAPAAAPAAPAVAAPAAASEGIGGAAPASADAKLIAATAQVDLLKSQLVTAQAEASTKSAELTNANVKLAAISGTHDALLAIARTATGKMAIALGGSSAAADTMDAATVVAEHARIDGVFKEKFKIGQQSKSVTETPNPDVTTDAATLAFQRTAALAQQSRKTK